MLLLHQTGSVKVGEVVRYTVTYTPSQDRILPSPEKLHVRVRNTSAVALRAAFVHGPYTLSAAAYPAAFRPNDKFEDPRRYGVPEFEPMVKAAGSWECELLVPEDIRQGAGMGTHGGFGKSPDHDSECATWVIEIASQVIFSTSAAVGYEVLVARDKKSLNLGLQLPVVSNQSQVPQPGRLVDHQQSQGAKDGHHPAQPRGIYSRAVQVKVDDTASLWNTPRLPSWDDEGDKRVKGRHKPDKPVESMVKTGDPETAECGTGSKPRKQKKVHLVILTHGLHSNLGADMLFLKESIDDAAKQAKIDRKARRAKERAARGRSQSPQVTSEEANTQESNDTPTTNVESNESCKDNHNIKTEDDIKVESDGEEDDDEEVIVRGYSGNATKTERGIKYLGKRLARYVLSMTYPDQPFIPLAKDMVDPAGHAIKHEIEQATAHKHSSIHAGRNHHVHGAHDRPYKITHISFIAHSLGGLVQTYAVAYIQKHSPQFFDLIKPVNFIALATPFLGLSNENPRYVRFALDFGLVGRTGKDLGLAWRAPTLARSGWGAIVGNLGETAHKRMYGESQAESKPLLRILPTGPAHTALKKFRNRTVYSNVVNDGIVPLRTSCLLFLDWHGLGRVEKARRDAGLVETMVGFGWAELTGTNLVSSRQRQLAPDEQQDDSGTVTPKGNLSQVPQPATDAVEADERASISSIPTPYNENGANDANGNAGLAGPLSGFFNFFRSNEPPKPQAVSPKQKKIYHMSQTVQADAQSTTTTTTTTTTSSSDNEPVRPNMATSGSELGDEIPGMNAPPTTTFFESAGDLLNPKLPDVDYIIDPSTRPRAIFHDRVYHPTDIPPPPPKKRMSLLSRTKGLGKSATGSMSFSSGSFSGKSTDSGSTVADSESRMSTQSSPNDDPDGSGMRVEEKIARGYHRDLSWRKVLVKLEPDAHNNIFVRRMFANAYGWPVVKHLTDVHFSDMVVARSRTEDEYLGERARDINQPPDEHGGETKSGDATSASRPPAVVDPDAQGPRSASETREALDVVHDLRPSQDERSSHERHPPQRLDSVTWSDRDWADSENESDVDFSEAKAAAAAVAAQREGEANDKSQVQASPSSPGNGDADGSKSPQHTWNWTEKIVGKGGSGSQARSPVQEENSAASGS